MSKTWLQIITLRNLVRDITQIEIVKMFFSFLVGGIVMGGVRYYETRGPTVVHQNPADVSTVTVDGIKVTAHINLTQIRSSCRGASVTRRMVRYADAALKKPVEVAFIREHDVPWTKPGVQDMTLDLTLYRPLEGDGWHFVYERNDNCGFWDDLFPSRPISAPPAPVVIKSRVMGPGD